MRSKTIKLVEMFRLISIGIINYCWIASRSLDRSYKVKLTAHMIDKVESDNQIRR